MCGRFTQTNPDAIQQAFDLPDPPPSETPPRYNIAPSQSAVVVRQTEGGRRAELLRWGLIPGWAKERSIASKLINARSETIHEKNSFKNAFKRRRCLIPADGFYEWKKDEDGKKTPHYIGMSDHHMFGIAGLWENWRDPETGELLTTFTVITTGPNDLMKTIHDRMPVILPSEQFAAWLDPEFNDVTALRALLLPFPAEQMTAIPVSTRVNSPKYDDASLIQTV